MGERGRARAEGPRNIGTAVFPDADLKVFLNRPRWQERANGGAPWIWRRGDFPGFARLNLEGQNCRTRTVLIPVGRLPRSLRPMTAIELIHDALEIEAVIPGPGGSVFPRTGA